MNPSKYIEEFLAEMVELLPNSEYRKRGKCPVKEMCDGVDEATCLLAGL